MSRVDPTIRKEEELTHNVEPPTMGPPTQLEASHEMIERSKSASLNYFRRKEGLGSYQGLLRTVLAQYSEQAICPRGLPTHRRENRHSYPIEADSARQSPFDTPGIGSYVGRE